MTLSDQDLQLLTAFVDGELSNNERQAALQLLNVSSEARAMARDLQENAHRLREMPRHKLDAQFAGEILLAIKRDGLKITRAPLLRRMPRWLKVASVAACLLLVVGVAYVASRPGEGAVQSGTQRFAFKEMNQEGQRQLLAKSLHNQSAVHLEIKVTSNSQAVDRLQKALEDVQVRTIIDGQARVELKKDRGQVEYLVYAENLKPEDIQRIMRQVASEDNKARKATFETLVVSAMSTEHRQTLSTLLGTDAAHLKAPGEIDPFDVKIIEAPKDANKDKKNDHIPSQFTPPERFAVILANTGNGGGLSAEIKNFLAQRQAQKPGTLQVLMVISAV